MKHLLYLFAALLLTINIANAQTQSYETRTINGKQYVIYRVKAGDTWASIAEKLGVTERSLIDQNKQTNGSLKGVSTLKVSMEKSTKMTSSVIIKNTEKEAPVELNSLPKLGEDDEPKKPKEVKPKIYGQELRTEFRGANSLAVYRIGAGDNINDLAKYYNCSVEDITNQNNLMSNTLVVGKILKIPIQTSSSASTSNVSPDNITTKTEEAPKTIIDTPTITNEQVITTEIVPTPTTEIVPAKIETVTKPEVVISTPIIENKKDNINYVTRTIRGKEYIIYSVLPKDSWKSIATKFGVIESVLKAENIQTNGSLLGVKTIKIPTNKSAMNLNIDKPKNKVTEVAVEHNKLPKFGEGESTEKPAYDKPKIYGKILKTEFKGNKTLSIYRVGSGDNINTLAKYFNCTTNEIFTQNNLTSNQLLTGKILKILGGNDGVSTNNLTEAEKLKLKYEQENTEKENTVIEEIKVKTKPNEIIIGEYLVLKKLGSLYIKHIVISGEDLTRISKEHYTTNTKITSFNNLKSNKLSTGQMLFIPTNKLTLLKLTGLDFDEVERQKNEKIIAENNIATNNIIETNNNTVLKGEENKTKPSNIDSSKKYNWGDQLVIKPTILDSNAKKTSIELTKELHANELHANSNSGETKVNYTHSVLVGETIEFIAKKYKISTSDIANWNNLYQNRIRVGQDLIVNLERARKPYLSINTVSPELNKQIKSIDKSDRIKYVEERGLCFLSDENFIGVAHRNVPVGTLLLLTSTENYKKIYVRVTSILENSNVDIILQVDKVVAKQLSFNSVLTNVSLSYGLVE
ncbi:MAG: LysM peptidoglycan-binding domain-containing protein [Bacteroidia bacterium]